MSVITSEAFLVVIPQVIIDAMVENCYYPEVVFIFANNIYQEKAEKKSQVKQSRLGLSCESGMTQTELAELQSKDCGCGVRAARCRVACTSSFYCCFFAVMDVYAALRWFFTKATTIECEPMVRGSGMRGKGSIVFHHNDSIGLVVAGVQDEGTGSIACLIARCNVIQFEVGTTGIDGH